VIKRSYEMLLPDEVLQIRSYDWLAENNCAEKNMWSSSVKGLSGRNRASVDQNQPVNMHAASGTSRGQTDQTELASAQFAPN